MDFLRPNEQRARQAIAMIYVVLAVKATAVLVACFQFYLIQTMINDGKVSIEIAGAGDLAGVILIRLHFLAMVVSAITFIRWFRRAYYNLHQKAPFVRRAEGWAAGGWFVPIVSLYVPYQIMRELYASTKRMLDEQYINPTPHFTTRYLGWWWALWIINGLVAQALPVLSKSSGTPEGLRFNILLGMGYMFIGIVLCFITVKVIRDYASVAPMLQELEDPATITDPYELQEAYTAWTEAGTSANL